MYVPDVKRTTAFAPVGVEEDGDHATMSLPGVRRGDSAAFIDALGVAALVLDAAGMIVGANDAAAVLLQDRREALREEPMLAFIGGSQGRAGFGREFMALARGDAHGAFAREVQITPRLGARLTCRARVAPLTASSWLCTLDPVAAEADADAQFGRAVTRALDALDEGVMLVDGGGRIVHANPHACELLAGRVEGRLLHEVVDPQDEAEVARGLTLARAGSWRGEVQLRRLDGDVFPAGLALASGAGEGAPAVALVRDLTAQRQQAFEARLSAQVDRALLSSEDARASVTLACQALAVGIEAPAVCVVTRVGPALERWRIRPEASVEVMPLEEADLTWLETAMADEGLSSISGPALERFGLSVKDPADLDADEAPMPMTAALALRAPTGVVGYLLVELSARSRPRRQRASDLVARVAPQIALGLAGGLNLMETRALLAYQSRLLDQTSVLLNSLDHEGRIVTWNRASEQLLGRSAEAVRGARFGVEFPVASDPQEWADFVDRVRGEGEATQEMGFVADDHSPVPLHVEGRAIREGGRVSGIVLVALDLRNRRALESQVLRSQKLASVGLLAAGIAHEINNPLSGVVGYSQLLLGRDLEPEIRERVEKISVSAERCRKIVEGVLLFSRRGGGERRPTELREVISRVTAIGDYQWRVHNVQVLIEAPHPVEIVADPDQLEQVLLNLMSNAVDAMPRGGAIRLELGTTDDGRARLEVTDTGQGIPSDVIPRIFDPFFSTKDIGKGTGLGLAISYGIIKDHGGDILVRSSPGEGTTFTLLLPTRASAHASADLTASTDEGTT